MKVLNYDECAERANVVRRTWDRIIENGKGPPSVEISARRRGVIDVDFEAWLLQRRRLPPGWADIAPQLTASGVSPEQADSDAAKNDEGEDESKPRRSKGPTRRAARTGHGKAALRSNRVRTVVSSR
jgi:hypothetical protein